MRPEKTWFVAQGRGFDSRHLHQSCLRSACRHALAETVAYATVSPHKAASAVPKWLLALIRHLVRRNVLGMRASPPLSLGST
jgi:hypothetical protein